MTQMESATIFRRVELPGSRIDHEIVLFDQQAGRYYATGEIGANIWEFLQIPRTFGEICSHLLESYDVDADTCRSGVQEFLTQMLAAKLVAASS